MDLYLPDDFVPHADYAWHGQSGQAWTDSLHAAHARDEGAGLEAGDEDDWLGGEALLTPSLQHELRATQARHHRLHAFALATDSSDWCAL